MDKKRRIPHEGLRNTESDGLPDQVVAPVAPDDTEGHVRLTVNPGTGGDLTPRHPSTGGELIDENDVEGHAQLTVNPGTGGDLMPRTPSTGGEFIDENDVEGHIIAP
jgi:hypothetical protein